MLEGFGIIGRFEKSRTRTGSPPVTTPKIVYKHRQTNSSTMGDIIRTYTQLLSRASPMRDAVLGLSTVSRYEVLRR